MSQTLTVRSNPGSNMTLDIFDQYRGENCLFKVFTHQTACFLWLLECSHSLHTYVSKLLWKASNIWEALKWIIRWPWALSATVGLYWKNRHNLILNKHLKALSLGPYTWIISSVLCQVTVVLPSVTGAGAVVSETKCLHLIMLKFYQLGKDSNENCLL